MNGTAHLSEMWGKWCFHSPHLPSKEASPCKPVCLSHYEKKVLNIILPGSEWVVIGASEASPWKVSARDLTLFYNIICCLDGWELMVTMGLSHPFDLPMLSSRANLEAEHFHGRLNYFPLELHFSSSCSNTFVSSLKIEWSIPLFICEIRVYGIIIQHKWRHTMFPCLKPDWPQTSVV